MSLYNYEAEIVRVIDGDSVIVTVSVGFDMYIKLGLRLYGIDCPEIRSRDKAHKAHGLLAKNCVEENLKVGEVYRITTNSKGKFGRYLATIKLSGRRGTINDLLVKSLLAVPYAGEHKRAVKALHEINRKRLVEKGLL